MNFISTFNELEKLYEETDAKKSAKQNKAAIKERLYDDEAPYGRGEQYPGSRVKPWANKAPQWWIDQGGTDASWKNNSKSSYYEDEKDRLYRENLDEENLEERLYDDEAPLGRGELYPSGTRTKADYARSDDVPGWWFQQGGTVDEWRKRVSGKKESLEEAIDDDSLMVQISECLENGESVLIHSRPGSGIVSRVKSCIKEAGVKATYISAYTNKEHISKVAESGQVLIITDLDKAKESVLEAIVSHIGACCIIGINYGSLDQAVSSKFDVEINDISDALYTEGCSAELTEAADDEEIEIVDDEAVEDAEPKQTIIECSKCGALVIVDEVEVDEESDLVNVKDKCKFCEEKEGYKIVGSVVPYEEVEVAEDETIEDEVEVVEEPGEELAEEDDIVEEGFGDAIRKVYKPASVSTQQSWEDELSDDAYQISDKRRAQLEKKFAKQREWEASQAEANK